MSQYSWIAGIMWDIVEFAREEGLETVEEAALDAITKMEPEVGPDPRGREHECSRALRLPGTFARSPDNSRVAGPATIKSRRHR